jgi:hypothetical protein
MLTEQHVHVGHYVPQQELGGQGGKGPGGNQQDCDGGLCGWGRRREQSCKACKKDQQDFRQASNRERKSHHGTRPSSAKGHSMLDSSLFPSVPSLDIPSNGQGCSCKFPRKSGESLGWFRLENGRCPVEGICLPCDLSKSKALLLVNLQLLSCIS